MRKIKYKEENKIAQVYRREMKYYLSGRCCMLFNVLPPMNSAYWHIRYQVGEVKVVGYQSVVVDAACRARRMSTRALGVLLHNTCTTGIILASQRFDQRKYELVLKNI